MKIKKVGEISYVIALLLLALGTVFCAKADLGMSMVASLSFCLKDFFGGWMGFPEMLLQATFLVIFCIVMRKFHWRYLLSFVSALLYSGALNLFQSILSGFTPGNLFWRILLLVSGVVIVAFSLSLFMNSYLPPEVYELFVKGLNEKYGLPMGRTKLVFDFGMLGLSVLTAAIVHFGLGGGYREGPVGLWNALKAGGIGVGTLLSALATGPLLSLFNKLLSKICTFDPLFVKLRDALYSQK